MTLATASATTAAPVDNFFAKWADMASWPEWNADTEWVRLDGDFVQGATGRLKPRGGPSVRFTVTALVPGKRFTDESRLSGARLIFDHVITDPGNGLHRIDVAVSVSGPLAFLWRRLMGKGLRNGLQTDLDALVSVVEDQAHSAA